MDPLRAIIMGVVQGLTEFLPVSSSGHLELADAFLGRSPMEEALLFSVMLHVATLVPVVVIFRRSVGCFVRGLFRGLRLCVRPSALLAAYKTDESVRLAGLILVATIPTGVIGLAMKRFVLGAVHAHPAVVGALFLVTAAALVASDRRGTGDRGVMTLGWREALIIGIAQGIAVLPGISRSGATIAACLLVGVKRDTSAQFSFVLAIPAIALAAGLETVKALRAETVIEFGPAAAGFVAAAAIGLPALLLVVRWAKRAKLGRFAFYLVPVGIAAIVKLAILG